VGGAAASSGKTALRRARPSNDPATNSSVPQVGRRRQLRSLERASPPKLAKGGLAQGVIRRVLSSVGFANSFVLTMGGYPPAKTLTANAEHRFYTIGSNMTFSYSPYRVSALCAL